VTDAYQHLKMGCTLYFWQHLIQVTKHVFAFCPKNTLNRRFSTQIYLRLPLDMLSHINLYSFNGQPFRIDQGFSNYRS